MEVPLISLLAMDFVAFAYFIWVYRVLVKGHISGDQFYYTRMAFTDNAVCAPYCWRPLVPRLARIAGFPLVSYVSILATPVVIYMYAGGGWTGFICGALFIGNHHIFQFGIRNPEYADGVGQLLIVSSVWAISAGSPLAWPLLILSALCRETIAAALGATLLFWEPILLLPLAVGSAAAYLSRKEDKENLHPLVEASPYATLARWGKNKGTKALHYAHTIQPLRGLAFTVPFVWSGVGDFARLGLLAFIPIWFLALPASGQSRIMCYGFIFLVPFVIALPGEWQWFILLISWFWPIDLNTFNETGDRKFAYAK